MEGRYILPGADIAKMLEIERASFLTPWQESDIRHDLDTNPFARYVGLYDGETLVGWGCVWLEFSRAHLLTISITPERRGEGLGRYLLELIMQAAADGGGTHMELECRRSNTTAQKLYKTSGFFRYGVKEGYYTDTGEDALLYVRPVLPEGHPDRDPYANI